MDTDIIIPIYNAFDFTKKCIETVIEHTDLTKHTLLLINDKSTDQRILPLLTLFTTEYPSLNITIINNESNQGFVRTVNIGMQHSSRDVVLLNSDTEVTKNWLPKIQKCAYSKAAIATVTPLSNNATLASVPDFMSENTIPSDFTIEEYAEIVERCSMDLFPEIPTANGFCMYIRREAINNIGLFDEKTFGKGYGEENDFSYRCLQAGYRHLLCDNTYIYHKGTQSFSQEKTELINSHLQILKSRYPSCIENTEAFVQKNPISDIQLNIRYAINSHSKKNVLIVIHDFKEAEKKNIGGTTLHVHDLIKNMKEEFNFHVLYYSDDDFKEKVNAHLANSMGNLLNRTLSMLVKYFDGEVKPEFKGENPLAKKALGTIQIVKNHFDNFEIAEAGLEITSLVDATNKYVQDTAPWTLAKEEKMTECGQVLINVLDVMCIIASLIYPYCPNIASDMAKQLSFDLKTKLDDLTADNIKCGKLISKEDIKPVFLRLDSELADKSAKKQ